MSYLMHAHTRFLYVHVGTNGRVSDGGTWRETVLYRHLEDGTAGVPEPEPLPGSDQMCQYCIVADATFPSSHYLVKPYPG